MITRIKDNIPLITAMLIFIGYWNLDSYYSYFGIGIYNYISASELILSFIPTIKQIAIITVIILALIFGLILLLSFGKKNDDDEISLNDKIHDGHVLQYDLINVIKTIYNLLSKKNSLLENKSILTKTFNVIAIFISAAISITAFVLVCKLGLYIHNTVYDFEKFYNEYNDVRIGIISFILASAIYIYHNLIKRTYEPIKLFVKKNGGYLLFVILLTSATFLSNQKAAIGVLRKKTNKFVSFNYQNTIIKTDSSIVYIGQTQGYIFLRDLDKHTNIIFSKSAINNISIEDCIR